ncbi:hypothetical protein GPJ56_004816 [Histomonas meleagridis]|uniref:uncharacterized protein n=1 Tax=Histomonas meleagridis TaxID=135588 RepID=UPI00355A5296|nr:hypothetical protein GPJ56_004816 [Histomonas meleagridis]KAH0803467.1 hypothetical protein GO595_003811 [Histomonas meleagridis]
MKFPERKSILLSQFDEKTRAKFTQANVSTDKQIKLNTSDTFEHHKPKTIQQPSKLTEPTSVPKQRNPPSFVSKSPAQIKKQFQQMRTKIDSKSKPNFNFENDLRAETTFDISSILKAKMQSLQTNQKPKKISEKTVTSFNLPKTELENTEQVPHITIEPNPQPEEPPKNVQFKPHSSSFILTDSKNDKRKQIEDIPSFVCTEGNESIFLNTVRSAFSSSDYSTIENNSTQIATGFMQCLKSSNESILILSLNLIIDIIPLIPQSFNYHLSDLITILLGKANQTNSRISLNASAVLRLLSTHYSGEILLFIGLKCPPSPPLLSFAANIVRKHESVLMQNEIMKELLPVCCSVYETTNEQRFSALSVGLLNKINEVNPNVFQAFANSVGENWKHLLRTLHLEPSVDGSKKPIRVFSQQLQNVENPEQRLENILHLIDGNKNKYEPIIYLQQFFEETKGKYFRQAIPYLVGLIRSAYFEEIEKCIERLSKVANSELITETVNYFKSDVSLASVDVLTLVIRRTKAKDLAPKIHVIIDKLKPMLNDERVEVRKSAVFCFVEMRNIIGKPFDAELNKLPNVSKKMIYFFYDKNKIHKI